MKRFRLGLLLCVLPLFPIAAQGDSEFRAYNFEHATGPWLQDRVLLDSLQRWEEHLSLHLDRTAADPGDYLFFKAYATTGPQRVLFSPSGVLKVELVNGKREVVSTQYYQLRGGTADGAVPIPDKFDPGTYTLRAYTRWMQNYGSSHYHTTSIQIGPEASDSGEDDKPSDIPATVAFQPEGGSLLAGLANNLAIVARDPQGCPVAIRGEIVNTSGSERYPVQSYGEGYGSALFIPQNGEQYRLKLDSGATYELPSVALGGYALRVNNLDPGRIRVRVEAAGLAGRQAVTLLGRQGLQTYFEREVTFDADRQAELEIPTAGLPAGTLDLVLLDAGRQEQALRPVQVTRASRLHIDLLPLSADFSKGGESAFRVRITDAQGRPVQTRLSLSIANAPGTSVIPFDTGLSGPSMPEEGVETFRQQRFLTDLKTLGSRPAGMPPQMTDAIRFPVQKGLELHAKVYNLDGQLLPDTPIQMMGTSDATLVVREARTDASGVLHLENLQVEGETQFVFRTEGDDLKSRLVRLVPIQEEGGAESALVTKSKVFEKEQRRSKLVETTPYQPYDTTGLVKLRQATVQGAKKDEKFITNNYGIQPRRSNVIYQDPERPKPMVQLVNQMPGVMIQFDQNGDPIIRNMRFQASLGTGMPLWILDGQILPKSDPYDPILSTPLFLVSPTDIERIEFIVDPADLVRYGIQASNGVFLVYTRSGSEFQYVSGKDASLNFKGYQPKLDFDTYLKERRDDRQLRKIPPATLYWNPEVATDANGEAIVRFRSPGEYSKVRVTAETVTPDGRVGKAEKVF